MHGSGVKWLFILSVLCTTSTFAQKGYNLYVTMAPTVTFDNTFRFGERSITSAQNETGANRLYPLYSVLDGRPDKDYTFVQNLARKFSWGLLLEAYLNERQSFNVGMEVGARGYKLKSERSVSSLISYRNWSMPMYFSHYQWLGTYWTLKYNGGFSLNYAYSLPRSNRVVEIEKAPTFYSLLGGGLEMAYMGKEGKLSFELAYYKGWRNVVDHVYIGVDNDKGERIFSTGTHMRLSMKYNFRRFERRRKSSPPKQILLPSTPERPDFSMRALKEPKVVQVSGDSIEICLLDDQTVDGDSVMIEWNRELLMKPIALLKDPYCVKVPVKQGMNRLYIHALNEGKIRPNTYAIRILDASGEPVTIKMSSTLNQSAVLELRKE